MIGIARGNRASTRSFLTSFLVVAFLITIIPRQAGAQEIETLDKGTAERVFPKKPYSPYAGRTYPTRVFMG